MAQITNNSKQPLILSSQSSGEIILPVGTPVIVSDVVWKKALESLSISRLVTESVVSVSNYVEPTVKPTAIDLQESDFNNDRFPVATVTTNGYIPIIKKIGDAYEFMFISISNL